MDIPIVYTGVRPGEKMQEELLGDGEEREPTPHPHIFRVRCHHISDRTALQRQIDELIALDAASTFLLAPTLWAFYLRPIERSWR